MSAYSLVTTATSTTKTLVKSNTAGSMLVVNIRLTTTGGPVTLQDTQRNPWFLVRTITNVSSILQMWVSLNCVGGANTITAWGNTPSFYSWAYAEFSNNTAGINVLNTYRVGTGNSTGFSVGVLGINSNDLVIGTISNETASGRTISSTGSFIQAVLNNGNTGLFYILNDSNTTETFSGTWSSTAVNWTAMIAAFSRVPLSTALTAQNGVWLDKGAIISPIAADSPGQPNIFYESGSKIFSGTVFKMVFSTTAGICYAESVDGVTGWTRYSGNPVLVPAGGKPYPKVFKNGSTYYLYTGGQAGPIKVYTATDLVGPYTLQNASALTVDQAWETSTFFGQLCVAGQKAGTWYGYYTAFATAVYNSNYVMGQATSTDLVNWTKNVANPVLISEFPSNMDFHLISGNYYGWSQIVQPGLTTYNSGSIPSDITRYLSTGGGPDGPFNLLAACTFYRSNQAEGVSITTGQVADPSMIEVSGSVYQYITITPNGTDGSAFSIGCAVASIPFSQLVLTTEGIKDIPVPSNISLAVQLTASATDAFPGANANPAGGNWTRMSSSGNFVDAQIVSHLMEPASADGTVRSGVYWNALAWPANHWSQITINVQTGATAKNGVILRGSTSGAATAYIVSAQTIGVSASVKIEKCLVGVFSTLVSNTYNISLGDVITGVVEGSTISAYVNGNLVATVVDTDITTGAAGISQFAPSAVGNTQIALWAGGSVSSVLISGNAGIAGATITYTGPTSGTVTADSSGNYAISGVQNGTYVVTPSFSGRSFTPTSQTVVVSGNNVGGINFTVLAAGAPGTLTITMLDATTVAVTIPTYWTATQFLQNLRHSGGVWSAPPDPATTATWYPCKDWKEAVTS